MLQLFCSSCMGKGNLHLETARRPAVELLLLLTARMLWGGSWLVLLNSWRCTLLVLLLVTLLSPLIQLLAC